MRFTSYLPTTNHLPTTVSSPDLHAKSIESTKAAEASEASEEDDVIEGRGAGQAPPRQVEPAGAGGKEADGAAVEAAALREAIATHEGEKRTLSESVERQKAELKVGLGSNLAYYKILACSLPFDYLSVL